MQRLMKIVRSVAVMVMLVGVLTALLPAVGWAGDAPAPPIVETVLAVLKAVLPTMLSFVGPYLTKGLAHLLSGLSPVTGGVVSTVLGSLISAIAAALEGLPADGYAAVGAGTGLTGHVVLQSKPIATAS